MEVPRQVLIDTANLLNNFLENCLINSTDNRMAVLLSDSKEQLRGVIQTIEKINEEDQDEEPDENAVVTGKI